MQLVIAERDIMLDALFLSPPSRPNSPAECPGAPLKRKLSSISPSQNIVRRLFCDIPEEMYIHRIEYSSPDYK